MTASRLIAASRDPAIRGNPGAELLPRRALLANLAGVAALAVAPGLAVAAAAAQTGKKKKKKVVAPPPPPPPVKRQNFRARRPEEIPPWEGFEDCPFGFPCVGGARRPR